MAKKDENMDLKKIIADADRYQEAVMEANRLGSWDSPTSRELYDIAGELYRLAHAALEDKIRAFEKLGRDLGFVKDEEDEEDEE